MCFEGSTEFTIFTSDLERESNIIKICSPLLLYKLYKMEKGAGEIDE